MRRRSSENKNPNKKYLRKIFFKIIIMGVTGFLLWCGWLYTKPDKFPIKHAKIFAAYTHVDQDTLRKNISPYLTRGFFYLNVISLKQQLLKLPWVNAVMVERQWCDTVVIKVTEQQAILRWGKTALINSEGKIFSPEPATFPAGLPLIFGPAERVSEIFTLYKKIQIIFEPLDLTLRSLVLNPNHYWELLLSNDITVYLKEAEPLTQLELLANLYKKITAKHEQEPKSIDLRYSSGFAVRW